jgi:hypothetical protein
MEGMIISVDDTIQIYLKVARDMNIPAEDYSLTWRKEGAEELTKRGLKDGDTYLGVKHNFTWNEKNY